MALTVNLKYLRHSPRKLRVYFEAIKGKMLPDAINLTRYVRSDAVGYIHQALKSAQDMAKSREFDPETMVVASLSATDGPRIKRVRANSRGRANHFQKQMAHLAIVIKEASLQKEQAPSRKSK